MKKYRIEKVLHEVIRDLPSASKANRAYELGFLTLDEALKEIADAIRQEYESKANG